LVWVAILDVISASLLLGYGVIEPAHVLFLDLMALLLFLRQFADIGWWKLRI
jgi:hypothetical protein